MKSYFYLILCLFFTGCFVVRTIGYGVPKVQHGHRLPHKTIPASSQKTPAWPTQFNNNYYYRHLLDSVLPKSNTLGLLIIKDHKIVYEFYQNQYDSSSKFNGFSLSKSFLSALVGIALQEGKIKSASDKITDYLPELLELDTQFNRIRIQHLLDMRSGIAMRYSSQKIAAARNYYGRNIRNKLRSLYIYAPPGGEFYYENANSQLLTWILEKATGMPADRYLQQKLWEPAGMESEAWWTIDDKKHQQVKGFCCLSATVRDFAKLGLLYLDSGRINHKQVLPENWVLQSINADTMRKKEYKNLWWGMEHVKYCRDSVLCNRQYNLHHCNRYLHADSAGKMVPYWYCSYYLEDVSAQGLFQQYIYINPKTSMVIVRIGNDQKNISFYPFLSELGWNWK